MDVTGIKTFRDQLINMDILNVLVSTEINGKTLIKLNTSVLYVTQIKIQTQIQMNLIKHLPLKNKIEENNQNEIKLKCRKCLLLMFAKNKKIL